MHAHGDSTGKEIVRSLIARARLAVEPRPQNTGLMHAANVGCTDCHTGVEQGSEQAAHDHRVGRIVYHHFVKGQQPHPFGKRGGDRRDRVDVRALILRAGIESVPAGQSEAARSTGLTAGQTMRLGISGLGEQRQRTVDAKPGAAR